MHRNRVAQQLAESRTQRADHFGPLDCFESADSSSSKPSSSITQYSAATSPAAGQRKRCHAAAVHAHARARKNKYTIRPAEGLHVIPPTPACAARPVPPVATTTVAGWPDSPPRTWCGDGQWPAMVNAVARRQSMWWGKEPGGAMLATHDWVAADSAERPADLQLPLQPAPACSLAARLSECC